MAKSRFEEAVHSFKRQLLEVTIAEHDGNRTHAAEALGLQRTHLLKLIRQYKPKIAAGRIGSVVLCRKH